MLSYWYKYRFGANSNANFLNIQINLVFRFLRIKLIFNLSSIHFYDPYLELWNCIFFKLEHFNVKIIAYPALLCHLEVWFWKHFFPVNIESIINYPSQVNYEGVYLLIISDIFCTFHTSTICFLFTPLYTYVFVFIELSYTSFELSYTSCIHCCHKID